MLEKHSILLLRVLDKNKLKHRAGQTTCPIIIQKKSTALRAAEVDNRKIDDIIQVENADFTKDASPNSDHHKGGVLSE